jgi:hypothetical protein
VVLGDCACDFQIWLHRLGALAPFADGGHDRDPPATPPNRSLIGDYPGLGIAVGLTVDSAAAFRATRLARSRSGTVDQPC